MNTLVVFLLLVTIIIAAAAKEESHATKSSPFPYNIHPLRPHTGAGGRHLPYLNCLSWRLGVETNNIRDWPTVPRFCEGYVGHYMLGRQYRNDCTAIVAAAMHYVSHVELANDGKDAWIFDIDETSLSNLPYYARVDVGFGVKKYNETKFEEWIKEAKAPAMPETLRLYRRVLAKGIKAVFLSATKNDLRPYRISNLHKAGFRKWEMLLLRKGNDTSPIGEYKSEKRKQIVNKGYRIVGNIGDQWSDLLGENVGLRTFKLPDPMYYIA